jgi:hypothetical protein
MKERTENPNPTLVSGCCTKCPLLASKPGNNQPLQHVLAAADSASRLKKLVDGKIVSVVFSKPDDLSAKRVAAYFGYLNAEAKSERNRFKKFEEDAKNKNKDKSKFRPEDYF